MPASEFGRSDENARRVEKIVGLHAKYLLDAGPDGTSAFLVGVRLGLERRWGGQGMVLRWEDLSRAAAAHSASARRAAQQPARLVRSEPISDTKRRSAQGIPACGLKERLDPNRRFRSDRRSGSRRDLDGSVELLGSPRTQRGLDALIVVETL